MRQQPFARPQRTKRLEQRRGSGAVIGRRRSSLHSVVVRHDEHRFAVRVAARKSGENVLYVPRLPIACADRGRLLNLRAKSERRELRDDVVAHTIVIGGAHRMRPLRDLLDV